MKIEVWTCEGKEERHYFLEDEDNTYVLGFNPMLISPDEVKELLASFGFKL